ncbi:unnamed protein product, partial [Polarella glacialis]
EFRKQECLNEGSSIATPKSFGWSDGPPVSSQSTELMSAVTEVEGPVEEVDQVEETNKDTAALDDLEEADAELTVTTQDPAELQESWDKEFRQVDIVLQGEHKENDACACSLFQF